MSGARRWIDVIVLALLLAPFAVSEQANATYDPTSPAVLARAGWLATTIESVSDVGTQNSNGIGGSLPWPGVLLSGLVSLAGFAAQVHLVACPGERRSACDLPSLILIAIICCLCLLTSLWAAFSGADPGAYLP